MESQPLPPPPAAATPHSRPRSQDPQAASPHDDTSADRRPQPAHTQYTSKHSSHSRDSVISPPWSPRSLCQHSARTSVCSIGPEEASPSTAHRQDITCPSQAHLDPEKSGYYALHSPRNPARVSVSRSGLVVYDHGKYQENELEDKACQILLFLSGPCALLSLVLALWSLAAILISLVLAPLRLCSSRSPLASQITIFLGPTLNLQLRLIYSSNSGMEYSSAMLVVIHLISPVVACGVALATWIAAAFCIFTSILGDPGGSDGHNDGKESILGIRNWWERWLSRCLRPSLN